MHDVPVIRVAEDRIVHDPQGENRLIAGKAQGRAIRHVFEGEPEKRSIRQGLRVLEHPPRGILPERETQVRVLKAASPACKGEKLPA